MKKSQFLENYLNEISGVKLLTPDEEIELAQRIKQNDDIALKKLVSANLLFVVSVAKAYQNKGLSLEDLINEGNIGLITAARRFDETRGFKFISYAVWWIKQSILQALAEKPRIIRLPLNQVGTLTKIGKAYSELEQELERTPTNEEIAGKLEIDSSDIINTVKKASRVASIDSELVSNSNTRLVDVLEDRQGVEPDSDLMDESLRNDVDHMLNCLTRREAKIIRLYFGLGGEKARTLEEVGSEFRLTRERIRQIKERALMKLRKSNHSRSLQQYLG